LIIVYIGLCAGGLPSLMMRRVAADESGGVACVDPVRVVLGGYMLVGAILLVIIVAFAEPLWGVLQLPAQSNMALALATTVLAGVIANLASVYAAVLSGLHRSYIAQMAETLGTVSQFVVAAAFIIAGLPAMGLAISLLAGKLTRLVVVIAATWRHSPAYFAIRPSLRLRSFTHLLREAKSFILLDTGNALCEAMVRALLVVMAGPSELGLYDIANRLPALIRNTFTYGLMALFPAIATLHAQRRLDGIAQVLRASVGVVVFLIITPLAAYAILAKPVLFLWLGDVGTQVSTITLITTTWWVVTSYNIPFYLAIQALGLESVVARNIWLHIFLIAVGSLSFRWLPVNALTVSWLVLLTGVIAQVQFYAEAQHHARLLSMAFENRRDRVVVVASLALLGSAMWLKIDTTSVVTGLTHMMIAAAVFASIWLAILKAFTSGRPLANFLVGLRGPPVVSDEASQFER
jgi:O-antigen/teichoic acid export membrane protein